MKKMKKVILLAVVLVNLLSDATAGPTVCQLIAKDRVARKSTVYLLDVDGWMSDGPIDFGNFLYKFDPHEFIFYIPTGYRVVTSTKWIESFNSDVGGTLHLTTAKPICSNSKTYDVALVSRSIPFENLPWHEDQPINESNFNDVYVKRDIDAQIVLRFEGRVVGTVSEKK
jgi:hypothetical protein